MKMGVKRPHEVDISGTEPVIQHGVFTEAEAELYDRQIRLWGIECQKRLRAARLLVVGLNGVGSEVVKNLALGGFKSITIMDDKKVSISDSSAQLFCSDTEKFKGKTRSEASLPAIQELNPNVKISIETGDPNKKSEGFFTEFDVVFATGVAIDTLCFIDRICRENNVQFYCADTWGFYGYCFLDLHLFKYKRSVIRKTNPPVHKMPRPEIEEKQEMIEEELAYFPFGRTLLAKVGTGLKPRVNKVFVLLHIVNHFRELHLRYPQPANFDEDVKQLLDIRTIVCNNLGVETTKVSDEMLRSLFGELSPVCAAIGGILANEMIKGVSRTGLPVHNYFLFDGHECKGVNELIATKVDEEL